MITHSPITIHSATLDDRRRLANLIHFEIFVHRHLDWRPPLEWLGYDPYLIAEQNANVVATLACPPDPPNVSWIRLFAVSSSISTQTAWDALWGEAVQRLTDDQSLHWVAAIPLQHWFQNLLEGSNFVEIHRVVMLIWNRASLPPEHHLPDISIRPMNLDDLAIVAQVDQASFIPIWQNSQSSLEMAFRQAALATVAEENGQTVGYQISTSTPLGGHLARLAVLPARQGRGIGYALVRDVLWQFERRGAQNITVNTQQNNPASLSLYQKSGFRPTGEEYPVYQFSIR